MRALTVENEKKIAIFIALAWQTERFAVVRLRDGDEALAPAGRDWPLRFGASIQTG